MLISYRIYGICYELLRDLLCRWHPYKPKGLNRWIRKFIVDTKPHIKHNISIIYRKGLSLVELLAVHTNFACCIYNVSVCDSDDNIPWFCHITWPKRSFTSVTIQFDITVIYGTCILIYRPFNRCIDIVTWPNTINQVTLIRCCVQSR